MTTPILHPPTTSPTSPTTISPTFRNRASRPTPTLRAFTLIELLVVIAIIALLIGILLPSLGGAREAGRAVVCQSHIRSLALSLATYEGTSKGWLPGPNTSGLDLRAGKAYVPGATSPTQDWDIFSPLLGDSLNLSADQLIKFQEICETKMKCPSNRERYTRRFQGAQLPIEAQQGLQPTVLSYQVPAYLLLWNAGKFVFGNPLVRPGNDEPVTLPTGYTPRFERAAQIPAAKAFAFEGARYYDPAISGFDYTTLTKTSGLSGSPQGNFNSRGPAFRGSGEPYLRDSGKPSDIFRRASLRHSQRLNAAFFDGHVAALDNTASANPALYAPSGSTLGNVNTIWWGQIAPTDTTVTSNMRLQ